MSTAPDQRIPPITLPWRLRIALEDADISRETMAEHLDVSVATLSRWMHGRGAAPKRLYLKEWAELTNVSLEWIEHGVVAEDPQPPRGSRPDKLTALTERKAHRVRGGGAHSIGKCAELEHAA